MMNRIDYKKDILPILKNAGKIITMNFRYSRDFYEKSYANYVTDLDKRVEDYVMRSISERYPDALFLSEESVVSYPMSTYWVLDPIDGTTNLLHGYKSVCIALSHVIEGTIVFGAVYCPITKELFYAEKGKGAFLNIGKHTNQIHVNDKPDLRNSLIGFGCPYDKTKIDALFRILKPLLSVCDDLKRQGPASLDICYVACGRLTAYVELDLELWDYSTGALILEEAGGLLTNFKNDFPGYLKSNILATNGKVHEAMVTILRNCE